MNFVATCVYVVINCLGYVAVLWLVQYIVRHTAAAEEDPPPSRTKLRLVALLVNTALMHTVFALLHARHPYIIQPHIAFQLVHTLGVTAFALWR